MAKILLASPDLSDSSIISPNSAVDPNFPVQNMQNRQLGIVTKTLPGVNTLSFTINIVSSQETQYDFLAILAANVSPTATIQLRTHNALSSLLGAPLYNSGVLPFWKHSNYIKWPKVNSLIKIPTIRGEQYVRVDIVDTTNLYGFIEVGRVYLSKSWTPTYNMPYNWSIKWNDLSESETTRYGNKYVSYRKKYRTLDFSLDWLSEAEMYDNAFNLMRYRGNSKDILVIPDIDNSERLMDQSIYGTLKELNPIINTNFNIYQTRFSVEELI